MTPPVGFYRAVLRALKAEGLPFLIGVTYAMARYTAIEITPGRSQPFRALAREGRG